MDNSGATGSAAPDTGAGQHITWLTPQGGDSFSLDDVVRIEIETIDDALLDDEAYWLLHFADAPTVRMTYFDAVAQGISGALAGISGADMEKVELAPRYGQCGLFLIWQKGDQAGS